MTCEIREQRYDMNNMKKLVNLKIVFSSTK